MRPHRDDMVSSFDVKKGKCYVELSGERKLQTFQFTERSNRDWVVSETCLST